MKEMESHTKEEDMPPGELIAFTAHQLRAPLTGLQWSCNLLVSGEAGEINPDQKKIITDMSRAVHYMLNVVNDFLNVHQAEEGHSSIILKKQSLVPVFANIQSTFKNILGEKSVICKIEVPSELPPVNIDIGKIEMAINNIVDNSIKYSPKDKAVEIQVSAKEKEIIISIKNSGPCIEASDLEKIFNKFFRSKSAIAEHKIGTGLGLYISKHIIEQHNGKIWFDSKENEGTTFYISLPAAE